MTPITYLGLHAVLKPGDFVLVMYQGKAPQDWVRVDDEFAYKLMDEDDCLRSLGLHRSAYAFGYRGVAGVDDEPITGAPGDVWGDWITVTERDTGKGLDS